MCVGGQDNSLLNSNMCSQSVLSNVTYHMRQLHRISGLCHVEFDLPATQLQHSNIFSRLQAMVIVACRLSAYFVQPAWNCRRSYESSLNALRQAHVLQSKVGCFHHNGRYGGCERCDRYDTPWLICSRADICTCPWKLKTILLVRCRQKICTET